MRSSKPLNTPINKALTEWACERSITPSVLATMAGFDFSHASLLLNRKATVTDVTIGRLIRAFGPKSLMPVLLVFSEEGTRDHQSRVA